MINLATNIVKTALSVPFTVVREGRKLVGSVLGEGKASEGPGASMDRASVDQAEREKAEIQAGIRDQARASIETVKVGEEIRDHNVTADTAPL